MAVFPDGCIYKEKILKLAVQSSTYVSRMTPKKPKDKEKLEFLTKVEFLFQQKMEVPETPA